MAESGCGSNNCQCLKWHMKLNPKKTQSVVVIRSQTSSSGYGDLTIGGAELEKLKTLHILGVTFDFKLTFETHLQEVMSKAARNLGVVHRAVNYLNVPVCSRNVNAFVLSTLEHCTPVRKLSAESHLGLLDSNDCSAERLCEGGLCCLRHSRKESALGLLCKIYRVDDTMNRYLKDFVAARDTRALNTLGELASVIPYCRTDQFSQLFLPAAVRLGNSLSLGVFSGGPLSSFKSAVNLYLLRA